MKMTLILVTLAIPIILRASTGLQQIFSAHVEKGAYSPTDLKQLDGVENQAQEMPLATSEGRRAFGEFQKLLYVSRDWDRFFARALYYRQNVGPKAHDFSVESLEV